HIHTELSHLARVFDCTDRGYALDSCAAKAFDHLLVRPATEAHRSDLFVDERSDDPLRSGLEHVEIHAERPVRERTHVVDGGTHFLRTHYGRGQEPERPGITRSRNEFRPCHPSHCGLYDGVTASEHVA